MTELANIIIEDGQVLRAIHNYLSDTYEDIQKSNSELLDTKFNSRTDFILFIQNIVCPFTTKKDPNEIKSRNN